MSDFAAVSGAASNDYLPGGGAARKLLGVIGGLGPFASAYFYKRLTELQKVKREQEYIDVLLYSKPSVPDRSAFILGESAASPLDEMIAAGRVLENAGVTRIALPCVTAHFFYDGLQNALCVPVINMVDETVLRVCESGAKTAGLLATDGTVRGRVLQNELEKRGIKTVTPTEKSQQSLMNFIYETAKQGGAMETDLLKKLSGELYGLGAETVIIGCTEISMAGTGWHGEKNIDALEVLAEAALTYAN